MDTNARVSVIGAVPPIDRPKMPVEPPAPKAISDIEASAHYRLLIEEGPRKGSFVYKTLDTQTGEIIRQFPREQLVKIAEAHNYDAGSVIKTSV